MACVCNSRKYIALKYDENTHTYLQFILVVDSIGYYCFVKIEIRFKKELLHIYVQRQLSQSAD